MKQEQTRPKTDGQTGARTDRSGRLPAPPPARYACSRKSCRHGRTHRPEDILWHEGKEGAANEAGNIKRPATDAGWYCVRCAADLQIAPKAPKLDEVLRAEGRDVPDAESRSDPACADCAFYGLNAKASTNAASRELLEDTHGIDDADYCHPASLIMRGNGVVRQGGGNAVRLVRAPRQTVHAVAAAPETAGGSSPRAGDRTHHADWLDATCADCTRRRRRT